MESQSDLPPTFLDYMEDTYRLEGHSTVLSFVDPDCGSEQAASESPNQGPSSGTGRAVVLDRTVLYPEGGGQPSDTGELQVARDPSKVFRVSHVKSVNGLVFHYGEGCKLEAGEAVVVRVDQERRMRHARLHSGGHLLDSCLAAAGGEYAAMEAAKGYHGEGGAYVEYKGKVPVEARDALMQSLQEEADRRIQSGGGPVHVSVDSYSEAAEKCGGSLPPYIAEGSSPRVVTMEGLSCPCGGTHVATVAEIGGLTITGIRVKKGITRISYDVPLTAAA